MKIIPVAWQGLPRNALRCGPILLHGYPFNLHFQDLVAQGIALVPFFVGTDDKPFDVNKFYAVGGLIISMLRNETSHT